MRIILLEFVQGEVMRVRETQGFVDRFRAARNSRAISSGRLQMPFGIGLQPGAGLRPE